MGRGQQVQKTNATNASYKGNEVKMDTRKLIFSIGETKLSENIYRTQLGSLQQEQEILLNEVRN